MCSRRQWGTLLFRFEDTRGSILDRPLIVHPRDKALATRVYRARHVDFSSTSPTRSSSISDDPTRSPSFFCSVFTDFGAAAAAADSAIISRNETIVLPTAILRNYSSLRSRLNARYLDMPATRHSVATSGRSSSEEREELFIVSIGRILVRLCFRSDFILGKILGSETCDDNQKLIFCYYWIIWLTVYLINVDWHQSKMKKSTVVLISFMKLFQFKYLLHSIILWRC